MGERGEPEESEKAVMTSCRSYPCVRKMEGRLCRKNPKLWVCF